MTEDKDNEKRPFRASDWLPTDNGPAILDYGNCVEVGLGLTPDDVWSLFCGVFSSGEDLGVRVKPMLHDGKLRVFLRVTYCRGLRAFSHSTAKLVWGMAMAVCRLAILWNEAEDDENSMAMAAQQLQRLTELCEEVYDDAD